MGSSDDAPRADPPPPAGRVRCLLRCGGGSPVGVNFRKRAAGAGNAERLVGVGLADFDAAYPDQRPQTARASLVRPMTPPP